MIDEGSSASSESVSVPEGSTALDCLSAGHFVDGRTYAGMGYFVTAIDGLEQDMDHSWMFFVDGSLPLSSVDTTPVAHGSVVEFRYMRNEDAFSSL